MKRQHLAVACLTVLALPQLPAAGAEMRPIAVFSFSGYQRFVDDLAALDQVSPLPGFLPTFVSRYLQSKTNVESLDGIDPQRPVGAVIVTDGLAVTPVVFVPVTETQRLLKSLEKVLDKPQPLKKGLWKIGRNATTGFVREQDGWAFIGQSEESLRQLPEPDKVLGGLPKQFDVAFQFNFRHVPEVFRTMAVDFIRLAMRNTLPRREGESRANHVLRRRLTTWRFRAFEHLLTDSRHITIGWTFDDKTRQAVVDLRLVPEPDSRMARQLASLRKTKTRFGSLGTEGTPLSFHVNWSLDKAQIQSIGGDVHASRGDVLERIGEFSWIRSDEERKTFQHVAGTVLDVVEKTIGTGQLDLAVAVELAEGRKPKPKEKTAVDDTRPLTLIAAAYVGQGKSLRQAFEAVAGLGKKDPRFAKFQVNVAKVKDVPVHAVVFPADPQQIAKRLFGEELKLYVAASTNSVYAAIGPGALSALEKAMTTKEIEVVAPLQLSVKLSTLTDLAGRMTGEKTLAGLANLAVGMDDRVTLTIQTDDRGLHVRAVAGEGVLRMGLMSALLLGR